jgi:drug/metabolite transporter (DMT)-like permease
VVLNSHQLDAVRPAVVAILFASLALSFGDALIKLTSSNFVIWQIFVLRSALAIPVLLAIFALQPGGVGIRPRQVGWTAMRSLLLVALWVCYYASLPHIDLALAAAMFYTIPIFLALMSMLFIGDRISRNSWIAILLGFSGVLLILRPNASDFNWFALMPVAAAALYASAMIITRTKCRAENPLALALALHLSFIAVGAIATIWLRLEQDTGQVGFLMAPWSAMDSMAWVAIGVLAIAALLGSILTAYAYQNAPPSLVGTFDFSYVAFAIIWGVLLFSEIPDLLSGIGIAVIVTAGVLAVRQ